MNKIPLIVVAGATASGKTALAIEIAKQFNGEIISADSMQIYRDMNIGTAKPDLAEQDGIVHHLMDFVSPEDSFSVAEFVALAHKTAADIYTRGKNIIVVGGTGLYIDSFVRDVDFEDEASSEEIRAELNIKAQKEGAEALLCELESIDPAAAARLHPNNLKRIIRAIEFYRIHGEPISEHSERTKQKPSRYRALYMMIDRPREELYARIDKRVDIMAERGLVDEARALYLCREKLGKTAAQAIGYKELFDFFDGEKSLDEALEEIKLHSRRYAKRQLTWFRRNADIHLLSPERAELEAAKLVRDFLS